MTKQQGENLQNLLRLIFSVENIHFNSPWTKE